MSWLRITLLVLIASLSTTAVAEEGWELFPVFSPEYDAKPVVSVKTGVLTPAEGEWGPHMYWGFELEVTCPSLKIPGSEIRQQLSYNTFEKNDLEIRTVELNPRYLIPLSDTFAIGLGPGFGYVMTEGPTFSEKLGALQVGSSLHYYYRTLFLGGELTYQYTEQVRLSPDVRGMNHLRVGVELGYNF